MPSRQTSSTVADLGDVQPSGSRQLGRRSSVCLTDDGVVAGLADGTVAAFDDDLREVWRDEGDDADDRGSVVALAPFADGVLAGERGAAGEIRLHDRDTGDVRWRYRTADDVGSPQKRTRFYLPFVVDIAVPDGGERAFVAARRYERGPDGGRCFRSVVAALDPDGSVAWRHAADASPISLAADGGDRLAVAYNRCPGDWDAGLVVLDPATGAERRRWDPPGDGDRRVGDVALAPGRVVAASHADYRGYCLDGDGVRWAVDLGRPVERGDETVYAYPNHVHATGEGVVFVTGNTYPDGDGRETDARHPNEHAVVGVTPDGDHSFTGDAGGFAHEIATDGAHVAVPVAQHFRDRDADRHGVCVAHVVDGLRTRQSLGGVGTAAALTGDRCVAVEEPVAYHDAEASRGAYRLHQWPR
ncbi:PQQ-binding-like beta-propeller repeat protein [Halobacterium jilantaiense]|uniref:PQQ-like domain-containing protein n=1 Tax=Halobacterium jilantaiense TaxID=355548 RepID=A0A1I0QMM4_9EURY|nr:PQQ-binding-like beta-propeller repeat protein [Halobacterium jilantaiense]SEW28555.1 hypothetical protein SAMN04487945_2752 [Halobacterium jilantaiense]